MKKIKNIKNLISLFFLFFKISLITFGGGYACLPIFEKELVQKRKMITGDELIANYAVAQMMPGIITVNIGVLIGYKRDGFLGSIFIVLGTVFPPLIIGILISVFLNNFMSMQVTENVFWGIRAGVCVLIFSLIFKLINKTFVKNKINKNIINFFVVVISFLLYYFLNLSPIYIIILASLFFVALQFLDEKIKLN